MRQPQEFKSRRAGSALESCVIDDLSVSVVESLPSQCKCRRADGVTSSDNLSRPDPEL